MHFVEYAQTKSNKTVQRAFVRKFSKKSPTAKQILSWKKKFEDEDCCAEQKDLDNQQQQKARSSGFVKHSCEAPKSP